MVVENRKSNSESSLVYPETTLPQLLAESAARLKRKEAVYFGGIEYSWQYVEAFSNAFANVLHELEVPRRAKIAVMLPNMPQLIMTVFGVWKAGCVAVLLEPWMGEKDLLPRLTGSNSSVIVSLRDIVHGYDPYSKIEVLRKTTRIEHVITTSMTDAWSSLTNMFGVLKDVKAKKREDTMDWLTSVRKKLSKRPPDVPVYPDDIALIHYVGPLNDLRQIELSHRALVINSFQFASSLKIDQGDVILNMAPLTSPFGFVSSFMSALFNGAKTVLTPLTTSYSLKLVGDRQPDFIEALRKHKVTIVIGPPSIFRAYTVLVDNSEVFRTVRAAICLPVPASEELKVMFQKISGIRLLSGYASSEGLITHLETLGSQSKPFSMGQVLPDTEAAVFHVEDNDLPLEDNQVGVLGVRGSQFIDIYSMTGLERSKVPRNSTGWIITGDHVKRDTAGDFIYVKPQEGVVTVGCYRVWKSEVEDVLRQHPSVVSCEIIEENDLFSEHALKANVKVDPVKGSPTAEELYRYLAKNLALYKVPVKIEISLAKGSSKR